MSSRKPNCLRLNFLKISRDFAGAGEFTRSESECMNFDGIFSNLTAQNPSLEFHDSLSLTQHYAWSALN